MKMHPIDYLLLPIVAAIFAVFAIIVFLSGRPVEEGEDE